MGGSAFAQVAGLEHPHHPEKLIVRFKEGTTTSTRATVSSRVAATMERTDPYTDGLAILKAAQGDLATTLVALRNDPDVLFAEPDYVITFQATPNDFYYDVPGTEDDQWGSPNVRAPKAWDFYALDPNFRVAVIDTGIAYDHPDLVDNIWTNPLEQPGDANGDGCPGVCGVDDDGDGLVDELPLAANTPPGMLGHWDDDENGYVDDIHGFDFANDDSGSNHSDPYPDDLVLGPHGTRVAGILAARIPGVAVRGCVHADRVAGHSKRGVVRVSEDEAGA